MAFLNLLSAASGLLRSLVPLAAAAANGDIQLLESIGNADSIPTSGNGPLGALGAYINLLYPWLLGMGAATAVLMGLVGGIQIMGAGADQGKYDAGKNRLMMSLGGLLLVMLASTILRAINPAFFK